MQLRPCAPRLAAELKPARDSFRIWQVALILNGIIGLGCQQPMGEADHLSGTRSEPQIAPVKPPESGPWFVNRAAELGLEVVTICGSLEKDSILESLGTGVAFFDFDGDGDLDIFVAGGSRVVEGQVVPAGGPWLFQNEGNGRWTDVTESSGLTWTGWAQGVSVADYNADGHLDLFVAQHGVNALWENQGDGTFKNVTARAGLTDEHWSVGATWGDFDGDGWPDLYVVNYLEVDAVEPPPPVPYFASEIKVFRSPSHLPGQPDLLYRNRGDGTFEDVTEAAGLFNPNGKGMAAVFVDLDADGLLDLFVTNDTQPNVLFWNLGDGHFEEGGLEAGAAVNSLGKAEGSMGIDVVDLSRNGKFDLLYSNFHDEGTRVLQNVGGRSFVDVSTCSKVLAHTRRWVGWGLILADFDHDGQIDMFQVNGHVYPRGPSDRYDQPPVFLRNQGAIRFDDVTANWGENLVEMRSGRSVAVGDLNGNGRLDLVMTTIDGPLRVLMNEGRGLGHAISVRLVGGYPNLEAIGAVVEVGVNGRTYHATIRRGVSFMAASDVALHFGLGTAEAIDHLRVHWPDATSAVFPGDQIPIDSQITIYQGDPKPVAIPFASDLNEATSRPGPEFLLPFHDEETWTRLEAAAPSG